MDKEMEDYQKHVRDTVNSIDSGNQISLCGEYLSFDWHFKDVDHAFQTVRQEGRLQPCPRCLKIINTIMS